MDYWSILSSAAFAFSSNRPNSVILAKKYDVPYN